jgi:RNA polymerase sigma-70 factor (ECF subfamily)
MVFNVNDTCLGQEFEGLFHEHYPLVYRTAYRVTGRAEDAEDVVQTLFLRLVRTGLPPGFRENPKGYLYRGAVNVALNVVRSRRRHVVTSDGNLPDVSDGRDYTIAESFIEGLLIEAVAQLDPPVVEMLVLRYEHDYSDAEIAKLLGKSRGVVAVTLYRARSRLKKLLRASLGGRS